MNQIRTRYWILRYTKSHDLKSWPRITITRQNCIIRRICYKMFFFFYIWRNKTCCKTKSTEKLQWKHLVKSNKRTRMSQTNHVYIFQLLVSHSELITHYLTSCGFLHKKLQRLKPWLMILFILSLHDFVNSGLFERCPFLLILSFCLISLLFFCFIYSEYTIRVYFLFFFS